jgi:hypothetical protein
MSSCVVAPAHSPPAHRPLNDCHARFIQTTSDIPAAASTFAVCCLPQNRPCCLQGEGSQVFLDAAEGQAGGSKLWITHSELQALFAQLDQTDLREAVSSRVGSSKVQQLKNLPADLVQQLKSRKTLYISCSLQDGYDKQHGVQAADRDAVKSVEEAASKRAVSGWVPSCSTRLSAQIAQQHEQALRQQAAAALAAGKQQQAAALQVLATGLRLRFAKAAGCDDMLQNSIVPMSLLLIGLHAGTNSKSHIDPAGALTYAFAVVEDGATAEQLQQLQQQVLARWLFVSPAVFTSLRHLRQLLWLLRHQLPPPGRSMQRSRKSAAAASQAWSVAELQQEMQKAVAGRPCDCFTGDEQMQLEQLLKGWPLTAEQMQQVAAFMGAEHAELVDQRPGRGVDVKVSVFKKLSAAAAASMQSWWTNGGT